MSSSSKNVYNMTFREFLDETKKQGFLEIDIGNELLGRISEEGFTNDEIYNMQMSKLWKLFVRVVLDFITDNFLRNNKAIDLNTDMLDNRTVQETFGALRETMKDIED